MNGNGAPPHLRNGSSASNGGRMSGDQRHMSTGSLNMPNGPQNGAARFEGPRSPPGKQSTELFPLYLLLLFAKAIIFQIPLMYPANFSSKANVRLDKLAPSAMIFPTRQRRFANTSTR